MSQQLRMLLYIRIENIKCVLLNFLEQQLRRQRYRILVSDRFIPNYSYLTIFLSQVEVVVQVGMQQPLLSLVLPS